MIYEKSPPPNAVAPVFHILYDFTCEWHIISKNFPKRDRYTLGERIFSELLATLTAVTKAQYASSFKKLPHLFAASEHINAAIVLIRITNTLGILLDKRYYAVTERLNIIGKHIGGWIRDTQPHKNPKHHS